MEAFVRQNLHVILFEHGPNLMKKMDNDMSSLILEQLVEASHNRYEIYTSEHVTEFEGDENGVQYVITSSGKRVKTDLVVIASGVRPNSELAKDAGIEIGAENAIAVNDRMQTNFEDISPLTAQNESFQGLPVSDDIIKDEYNNNRKCRNYKI